MDVTKGKYLQFKDYADIIKSREKKDKRDAKYFVEITNRRDSNYAKW